MLVIWLCTAIGVLVYGMLAWILVRHRRSRHPLAAGFEDKRLLVIIWTAIPAIIVIGIAIQSTEVLKKSGRLLIGRRDDKGHRVSMVPGIRVS